MGSLVTVFNKAGGGHAGEVVVGQVVRTLKHAFTNDPASFERTVIEGVGLVFNRYNGKVHEKDLASRIGAILA